jgi:ectoine hydroxylase-related dioxygenase (phytanoyl-CoA dioxygenase family)
MAPAGLNQHQLARYQARGFVAVRGRFTAKEIARWATECDRLWALLSTSPGDSRVQFREHVNGTAIADRIDPLLDVSAVFRRLSRDPRIMKPVEDALDGHSKVIKGKLISKRPGTHGYGLHQDFPYWQEFGLPADHLLTVQVAIDPSSEENGGVELWPSRHQHILPAPPGNPLDVAASAVAHDEAELIPLAPGDMLFFHSLAPHRSAPNKSNQSRRAVFITYGRLAYGRS